LTFGPRLGTKGFEFLGQATNPDKGFLDMAVAQYTLLLKKLGKLQMV